MKYATLLVGLAIVMASIASARAENTIPSAYRGAWCLTDNNGNVQQYKRCRETDGEQDWEIQPHLMTNGEAICIPLAIVTKRNLLSVRFECSTPEWKDVFTQSMQLSADGQRLTIKD